MKIPQKFSIAILLFVSMAIPSLASVVVNTPANGSTVQSPFNLSAYTSLCSGQQVITTGYSLDNSATDTFFQAPAITTSVWAPAGGHTLHVKAWGASGAVCVTDVAIIVGYAWSGLMFVSAALNLIVALNFDVATWSAAMSIYGIVSKAVMFLAGYAVMRTIGRRRRLAGDHPRPRDVAPMPG